MNYHTREEQLRAEISKDEAIRRIEKHGSQYDQNSQLDIWDQLLVCEAVAEATPVRDNYYQKEEEIHGNENAGVSGDVFDSYKRNANFGLTESERKVITQLEACTYRTPPIKVAALLEEIFREWPWYEVPHYWLRIAQKYPPRRIYGSLRQIIKQQADGRISVQNPAKLFSFLIKMRSKRKRH